LAIDLIWMNWKIKLQYLHFGLIRYSKNSRWNFDKFKG
jgi:hypothetical protein